MKTKFYFFLLLFIWVALSCNKSHESDSLSTTYNYYKVNFLNRNVYLVGNQSTSEVNASSGSYGMFSPSFLVQYIDSAIRSQGYCKSITIYMNDSIECCYSDDFGLSCMNFIPDNVIRVSDSEINIDDIHWHISATNDTLSSCLEFTYAISPVKGPIGFNLDNICSLDAVGIDSLIKQNSLTIGDSIGVYYLNLLYIR